MKTPKITTSLLAGAVLFTSASLSAATTGVVGYTSIDVPLGSGTIVAPAFVNSASDAGVLSGVTAGETSTLTVGSLSGAAGAYNKSIASAPLDFPLFYLEILNDTASDGLDTEGIILDVVSNTTNQVVVDANTSTLGIQGNENFVIRKHITIGDLSEGASPTIGAFESATIYNGSGAGTIASYFADGSNGWTTDGVTAANDAPIHPGTGVVLNLLSAVTLVVDGEVKESPTQIPVYQNVPNLVGLMKPVANFDVGSDSEIQNALDPFESVTIYADGAFTPTTVFNNLDDNGFTTDGVDSVSLVIDGTQQTMVLSTASNTVYKASGTVIPE